jgi:hypothetical protein
MDGNVLTDRVPTAIINQPNKCSDKIDWSLEIPQYSQLPIKATGKNKMLTQMKEIWGN